MLEFYTNNSLQIDTIYSSIIILMCMISCLRINRLYSISKYNGIKYFRNVLMMFCLGFASFVAFLWYMSITEKMSFILLALLQYGFIMASFYLLYSLIWKRFENQSIRKYSFLGILHLLAIGFSLLYSITMSDHYSFIPQLIAYCIAIGFSYINMKKVKSTFSKLYFFAIILFFIETFANYIDFIMLHNTLVHLIIYLITLSVFGIILGGVLKKRL